MPKKILFFIESLEVGGAEKSLVTLLNSLDFKNCTVDLMMLKKGRFVSEVPPSVNISLLPELRASFLKRVTYYFLKKINLRNLHAAQHFWKTYGSNFRPIGQRYDIAIAYSQGFSTYFVAEKITAPKKYAWLNTDYRMAGYKIEFDLQYLKKYNSIIAVSTAVEKSLSNELQTSETQLSIQIIKDITDYHLIFQQASKPLQISFRTDAVKIVTVCRLVKEKGLYLAIESCALLLKKNLKVNWYVIGDGPEHKSLTNLICERKLQESFFLVGADINPYPYMKACDIYVQTSLFEGLGLAVIEATGLNKPIVCTNFLTAHDILEDEKTGLIADMNAVDISSKLERLILDRSFRQLLSDNLGRKQNSDHKISIKQIEQLLFL